MSRVLAATVVALVGSTSVEAAASTMLALDLSELSRRADEVVVAEVVGARAEPARGLIVTRVAVRVTEPVAGAAGSADLLDVMVPGGELHGVGQLVHGAARLEPGRRYLLFLERRDAVFWVVGMAQGALPVREEGGHLVVAPAEGLPVLVQRAGGRLVEAQAAVTAPTALDRVVSRIREARRALR